MAKQPTPRQISIIRSKLRWVCGNSYFAYCTAQEAIILVDYFGVTGNLRNYPTIDIIRQWQRDGVGEPFYFYFSGGNITGPLPDYRGRLRENIDKE